MKISRLAAGAIVLVMAVACGRALQEPLNFRRRVEAIVMQRLKGRPMWFAPEIRAIRERDPASRSDIEAILTSPGLHAIALHRVSHWMWRRGLFLPARLLSQFGRALTGIEIHPGARLGRGVFIDHGMGVVVGETTTIGNDVTMYQGVTLGGTGKERGKRHPTIEDKVIIGVGASVLGAVTIGEGARVGAGSVVLKDVPAHTTAVGIPARAVSWRDPASGEMRRLEHLPDPDRDTMLSLMQRIEELESRLLELERSSADRREDPVSPAH